MKIYPILLLGLHQALQEALFTDAYADKVLEKTFKANKKWEVKTELLLRNLSMILYAGKPNLSFI
ncbi:MAG: hypothetical protein R2836_05980 [Chitinophagales bacterium]